MNREIKFRAWDGIRMTTSGIQFSNSTGGLSGKAYGPDSNEINMPLMQYTGLKDKNGVEIYEGDLLSRHEADPMFLEFYDGRFGYNSNSNNQGFSGLVQDRTKNLFIIGNIHENPELLEGEK